MGYHNTETERLWDALWLWNEAMILCRDLPWPLGGAVVLRLIWIAASNMRDKAVHAAAVLACIAAVSLILWAGYRLASRNRQRAIAELNAALGID